MEATTQKTVWYLGKNGTKQGPYTAVQLKEMGEAGLVTADMKVWKTGLTEWQSVAVVKGLKVVPVVQDIQPVVEIKPVVEYRKNTTLSLVGLCAAIIFSVAVGGFVAIEAAKQYAYHQVKTAVEKSGKEFAAKMEKDAAEMKQVADQWSQQQQQLRAAMDKASAALNAR